MTLDHDTIAAIATPPGRGGIGIVRLSGPLAATALLPSLTLEPPFLPRHAHFTRIHQAGHTLDEAIVIFYPAPHSYTGEDVLELAPHGSPVVLAFLLDQAVANGARLARPGEFTERAFLNRRLDLTQAEAVRDLIESSTLHQARLAAEQLGGALSRRLAPTKQALLHLIAALEAGIDFSEDDIDVLPDSAILAALAPVTSALQSLANSFRYGRILNTGLTLAIVGPPNVGKSSLFNRLLDRDRAIVTATPGTTRDLVTDRLAIGGIPVELIDTAGLRSTTDEAEALGIARSYEAAATADLVLLVSQAGAPPTPEHEALLAQLNERPHLCIHNKIDLSPLAANQLSAIPASALTGEGIETIRQAVANTLGAETTPQPGILTSLRHHHAVTGALASLAQAQVALRSRLPHEVLMLDLYAALNALDDLTGTTTPDDVLHLIFSTFCIGK